LIKEVNKRSNNLYAEQIYRRIGNGDLRTAERQTMRFLNEEGINARYFVFADGSGLSRRNLVSPEGLARLLAVMTQHEEAIPFRASLAQSGERGSTLRYRLTDLNTNGKTGSMERVRSLAGYVETTSGRELAFVVFANNYPRSSAAITSITDQIIRELASL
jgi:D-alanyl-D-alanine carboxypeptidase/D-alanyl-D-alanine-endopeptidase (penicillin-binding protein 4)